MQVFQSPDTKESKRVSQATTLPEVVEKHVRGGSSSRLGAASAHASSRSSGKSASNAPVVSTQLLVLDRMAEKNHGVARPPFW